MMVKSTIGLRGIAHYFLQNGLMSSGGMRWRRWLPLLGWIGIIAIGVLVICLSFYLSTILPLQARLDVAQITAVSARENIVNANVTTRRGGETPSEQLAEFYKFFPVENDSPQWLGKLVAVAEKNGLSLNDGEYKVTQDKVGNLMRYKITLPVQGKYTQVRKFLLSLKTEVPVVALENVQFERKDIVDANVQAKIKLVLYLVQAS